MRYCSIIAVCAVALELEMLFCCFVLFKNILCYVMLCSIAHITIHYQEQHSVSLFFLLFFLTTTTTTMTITSTVRIQKLKLIRIDLNAFSLFSSSSFIHIH